MPRVENISVEALENKDVTIHLRGSDDIIMYEITKSPQHAAYAIDPHSGHLQYRSEKGFSGIDRITYIGSNKDGVESLPADIVIDIKSTDDMEKVFELTLEVPANPTVEDIVDLYHVFVEELEEIVNGDKDD